MLWDFAVGSEEAKPAEEPPTEENKQEETKVIEETEGTGK